MSENTGEKEKKRDEEKNKELQEEPNETLIENEEEVIRYYTKSEITDCQPIIERRTRDVEVYSGKIEGWKKVAVKELKKCPIKIEKDDVETLIRLEQHPNILHLYGILWDGQDKTQYMGYVMEYFEGQKLSEIIYDGVSRLDSEMFDWIEQITYGLQFLHNRGICYGVIKPQNILLAGNHIKLDDSGMSKYLTFDIDTIRYAAPEVLQGQSYSHYSDIYSLAIITWEIIHRKKPYSDLGEIEESALKKKIIEGRRPDPDRDPSRPVPVKLFFDTAGMNVYPALIPGGWHNTPSERPELKTILYYFVKYDPIRKIPYYTLSDFKLDKETLGQGAYGNVFKGSLKYDDLYKWNKRTLAVKVFNNNTGDEEKYCYKEIATLRNGRHPNIVELHGVIWSGKMRKGGTGRLYDGFVMEYMELGSLDNVIHNKSESYDISLVATWITQIGLGLQYLHQKHSNTIHRDIKPQNILLAARDHLKLADFGIATISITETMRKNMVANCDLTCDVGTMAYTAPEVFVSTDYGPPADVYSFGVTIGEIIYRKKPWEYMTRDSKGNIIVQKPAEKCEFEVLIDLVKRCVEREPTDRIAITDILDFIYKLGLFQSILIMGYLPWILKVDQSEWKEELLPLSTWRDDSGGVLFVGHEIYLVGGDYNYFCKLDFGLLFTPLNDKIIGRKWIKNSCFEWNGYIWMFGGEDREQKTPLKSVERYDTTKEYWEFMPDMIYPRSHAATTVWKNRIIVSGGITTDGSTLNSVEWFNPEDGIWTELPNMPTCLRCHSLVSYKNKIIAMGGKDEKNIVQNNVYQLDPLEENPTWKPLPPMNYPAYSFYGIVFNDKIYAIGGSGRNKNQPYLVEVFDGTDWRGQLFPPPGSSAMIIPHREGDPLDNYPF